MSRAIKVEDQVYQELDLIREKGETFSQVVATLLSSRKAVFEFLNVLEGQLNFREWQRKELERLQNQESAALPGGRKGEF